MRKGIDMIAGVPGIGISGLFYLLSAFFMPFYELVFTLQGRSSLKRWKLVAIHYLYFWGIVLGSYFTVVLLEIVLKKNLGINWFFMNPEQGAGNVYNFAPVLVTLSLLVTVLCTVKIIRLAGKLNQRIFFSKRTFLLKH